MVCLRIAGRIFGTLKRARGLLHAQTTLALNHRVDSQSHRSGDDRQFLIVNKLFNSWRGERRDQNLGFEDAVDRGNRIWNPDSIRTSFQHSSSCRMARLSKNATNILHCHRSIESYCAEKTEELLKYMVNLFSDFDIIVGSTLLRDGKTEFEISPDSNVDELRHAMGECNLSMHLQRMQLEVLSRVTRRKERDLSGLAEKSVSIPSAINAIVLATRSLPTLPNEVLLRIFSLLYRMDDARETTLAKLIEDEGTPENWRLALRGCMPTVIATTGAIGGVHDRENHNLVGRHPPLFYTSHLEEDTKGLLESKSTFIFATLQDLQQMKEIQQFPWYNLVLSIKTIHAASRETFLRTFVREYSAKLIELDQLDIRFALREGFGSFVDVSTVSNQGGEEHQLRLPQSKLRKARVQLGMLPILHPFLCNIVDLEITVSSRQFIPTSTSLLRWLTSYSNTLANLKYINRGGGDDHLLSLSGTHSRFARSPDTTNEGSLRFSFPRLKKLMIVLFPECYAGNILQQIDSPALHHLALSYHTCPCQTASISAVILHNVFPALESISMTCKKRSRDIQFYTDLSTPHEDMEWLLPMLRSISIVVIHRGEMGMEELRDSLLAIKKVVNNRLSATPGSTSPIHSVYILHVSSLPESEILAPETLNTFKLLVPEFVLHGFDEKMF
ncbi:hypothetical protein SCHPADRAFT_131326 [Schizopora paradoxa]|uniref:Uncharacterized protein n=1 Tax=Schizopora paradoxa TaxID=27342 RepID=A0A0H2S8X7_9AGAM|nr:hypothetical protein SCHPADRAFT_131326 [Schizopora paradoxa]